MEKVNIKITGITPLLMNRFPMEEIKAIEKKPVEEQLEICAYRVPTDDDSLGELYIPGECIRKSIQNGVSMSRVNVE